MNFMRIILCLLCLLFFACKQKKRAFQKETSIRASFQVDDSSMLLDNNFKVFLDGPTQKIACRIEHDTVFVPHNLNDSIYTLRFIYGELHLAFDSVQKFDLLVDQRVHWALGVDNKPFDLLKGAISFEDYKRGIYSKVEYLILNLQERGDGIQFVNKIK